MERYIYIDGEQIPVTEEVYRAYKRPIWREKKRREREKERGAKPLSLEKFTDDGFDIQSNAVPLDEVIADKLLEGMLPDVLAELTDDERRLIIALYYEKKTEREIACDVGVSQPAIHKRRKRILKKIKNMMS